MILSDISIRRPVFAWMLMFGLIVFGAISMNRLGISQMPAVDFPVLRISVGWEGAAPEIIEAELIDRIEQAVISVEGLKEVRSSVRQGQGSVELEFELDRDIDAALQEVQAGLSHIRMPLNVDPPTIGKNSTDGEPIMFIGVSGSQPLREMIEYIDSVLIDQFQVIPGVGEVMFGGFSDRNLRIWVDNSKLKQYDLTILDVQQAIQDEHTEMAGGYIENKESESNIRTMGEGLTAEAIGNIMISRRGGQLIYDTTIRIKDVARVEDGLADVRRMARVNGEQGVTIGLQKQRGSNEVKVGKAVKAKIEEMKKSLPPGMKMDVNIDFTQFVEQSINATQRELLTAGIATALICFFFLGTWSSGFNILLSIPTSIIGSFIIIYFSGFTMNSFTLLALALAMGIVVDDAIMVLENIVRHFRMGKNKIDASLAGSREITFAATAATLAVIAIFLPVAFMGGIIGRFFYQFGITLSAAVALSLLEAITITPMRLSQMMANTQERHWLEIKAHEFFDKIALGYRSILQFVLAWKWVMIVVAIALFVSSLYIGKMLRQELIPPQDQSFLRMNIQTQVGSSLTLTDGKMREIEAYLKSRPEVKRYSVAVGGFQGVPNQGMVMIALIDKKKRPSQSKLMQEFREDLKKITGVRITLQDISARGLTPRRSQAVEFNLQGPDFNVLDQKSKEIVKELEKTGFMADLDTNYRTGMPEIQIVPNREAAAMRGVSIDSIGRTINAAIGGIREGKFTSNGRRYDIRIRLNPEDRLKEDDIKKLMIRTSYGEMIPLSDVVDIKSVKTVQSINRVNRQRAISVTANLAPGKSQSEALKAAEATARRLLPAGYSFNFEGGSKTFLESSGGLWFAMILGIIVAYMVLASQFNSFIHPFTVLLALPFSISGALAALYLTNQSLNIYSAIGIILLMGIVKKNSILLVEFTNQKREQGMSVYDALLTAAPIRLRPILMTSIATMVAALPIALGLGEGSETRRPMALAIIGGVLVSTMFTLVVVPCAYQLMSHVEKNKKH